MTRVSQTANRHGMPTQKQFEKSLAEQAFGALKSGTAKKLAKAPAGADKATPINITPKGLMGVGSNAYVIGGEVYLKQSTTTNPPKTTWFDVGGLRMTAQKPTAEKTSTSSTRSAGGSGKADIFMPSADQLKQVYGAIVDQAQKAGKLDKPLAHAPVSDKQLGKLQGVNVTPKFLMGSSSMVYDIKGELYLRRTAVTEFPAKSSWYKLGPAPMF